MTAQPPSEERVEPPARLIAGIGLLADDIEDMRVNGYQIGTQLVRRVRAIASQARRSVGELEAEVARLTPVMPERSDSTTRERLLAEIRVSAALRAQVEAVRALADWHETKAEKARRFPGEGNETVMEKAAQVHDDAARRLRALLPVADAPAAPACPVCSHSTIQHAETDGRCLTCDVICASAAPDEMARARIARLSEDLAAVRAIHDQAGRELPAAPEGER